MQPSHSLIAVSIGAVMALCPIKTVPAHAISPMRSSSIHLSEKNPLTPSTPLAIDAVDDATELAQQLSATQTVSGAETVDLSPEFALKFRKSLAIAEAVTAPLALTPDPAVALPSLRVAQATISDPTVSDPTVASEPGSTIAPIEDSAMRETAAADVPAAADTPAVDIPSDETTPTSPALDSSPAADPTAPEGEESTTAPAYLDSNPNPLQFPTQPEEVEVIGTQPITLRQALELAQRNSEELQTAQQQVNRSRAELRQALAAELPTLDVSTGLTAQEAIEAGPTQFNPATGQFESGDPISDTDTTLRGAVELNYDLFTSGQRSATIRAAERQVRFQELQLETTSEDLRLNVTRDYYDMQDADEQVRIAQSALTLSLRNLQDTQAQERAGIGTRFDVLQAQVQVANDRQTLTQQLSQQRIARRQLVQRLNLSESVDVSAADPVEVADLWNLGLEDSIVLAYRNRAELEQQLVQREVGEQQRRAALATLGPQVSLFASYSFDNVLDTGEGFDDTYQLGAQVNLRLFDGGAARANAQQQEANIAIAEAQFANLRSQVRFQVEQAYYNLQSNFDNIQTASLAQEQAAESLRLARLRFQAGVGIQSDVLRAQSELTQAEVNRLEAVLGYNRSLAEIQRAVSNFPDSNLAYTP
jgi:outer membrane protein TolC